MEKNFKLLEDDFLELRISEKKIYRIECTKEFINQGKIIEVGTKGGYVQSTYNIKDNAWVADYAWVIGNAIVSDNALMKDNACAMNDAEIKGNAIVGNYTWVTHNACVMDNAEIKEFAEISGSSIIGGNSIISGKVKIEDNTIIKGDFYIGCDEDIEKCTNIKSEEKSIEKSINTTTAIIMFFVVLVTFVICN